MATPTTSAPSSSITAVKVTPTSLGGQSYSMVYYKMGGTWHQHPRPFKDPKDAKRVAKSIKDSQGFNLLTTGGMA